MKTFICPAGSEKQQFYSPSYQNVTTDHILISSHILSHSVSRVKYIEVKDVWVLHYLLVLLVENHTVINNILRSVTYNKTQHRNQIIKKVHDITLESYLKLDIICTSKCINKKTKKNPNLIFNWQWKITESKVSVCLLETKCIAPKWQLTGTLSSARDIGEKNWRCT